jgi:hypothetical protein
LTVDEDRRAAAYLEFTAAGAVPAKSLAGYADDLAKAFGPKEAEKRFFELNVHRIKAGVPPWTGMAKELQKLAKLAKREAEAEEELLREVIASPSLKKAPPDFWASYRATILKLSKQSKEIRDRFLWLFPEPRGFRKFLPTWLTLLDEIGAVDAMQDNAEAARWFTELTKHVTFSDEYGSRKEPIDGLYFDLMTRLAPRLKAVGQPLDLASYSRWAEDGEYSPDILEAALEAGLTLATPRGEDPSIDLADVFVRDPVRLAAHPEYAKLLETAVGGQFGRSDFEARAKGKTGLVLARKNFLMGLVKDLEKAALPDLESGLETLREKTTPATFVEFPEAHATVRKLEVAPALARTLRGGVYDELTWPAFEAAAESLAGPKVEVEVHGTMQNPILAAGRKVIVFDGKEKLHELDLPAVVKDASDIVFLDGDLLVTFWDRKAGGRLAVWGSDPKNPFATNLSLNGIFSALPVPGATGVTIGGAAIHKGDRPEKAASSLFVSDGTTFWSVKASWREPLKLLELDPKTGTQGRASWPDVVRETSEKTDGLFLQEVQMMPAPRGAERSLFGHKNGLVGFFVRQDADRHKFELVRIDGKTWSGKQRPDQLVDWPGTDTPKALSISSSWSDSDSDTVTFWDDEGETTGEFGDDKWDSAGFKILPREAWLHYLEVRDLESSRALRQVTDDAMRELLKAVPEDDDKLTKTKEALKTAIPGLTNEVIRAGVANVIKAARERVEELERLQSLGGGPSGGLTDDDLEAALPQLETEGYTDGFATTDMKAVAEAFRAGGGSHQKLTASRVCWEKHLPHITKLACFVASRSTTSDAARTSIKALLEGLKASGLFGMDLVRAELKVKTGSAFLTRPKGKDVWLATEGDAVFFARIPNEDEDEPVQEISVLAHGKDLVVPKDATLETKETIHVPDDGAFIDAFLAELEARGPAKYDPEAAKHIAAETGLTAADAALLLAGMPNFRTYKHDFLGKELRESLDLKVTDADRARDKLRQLPEGQTLALTVGAGSVKDAKGYWAAPTDDDSVAKAFIATAKELFGKSVALREDLVLAVEKDLSLDLKPRKALALLLTAGSDPPPSLLVARKEPVDWHEISKSGDFFSEAVVSTTAALIPYLAFELPVGDEYTKHVPALYRAVVKLLEEPEMRVGLGSRYEEDEKKRLARMDAVGGKPFTVKNRRDATVLCEGRDNGVILIVDTGSRLELAVRTSRLRTDRAAVLPYFVGEDDDDVYGIDAAQAALYLLSKECEALVARIEKSPVPAGSFEANPLLSVKGTVEKLADAAGVDANAAALYLQMLALPNPTKKAILRWNSWKPADYDAAAAALTKKKLVIEGERERAGRDIFLPGGWEKKSRGVSMETYKLALYEKGSDGKIQGPVHALFERAFARWSSGDKPGFEDVTKKKS